MTRDIHCRACELRTCLPERGDQFVKKTGRVIDRKNVMRACFASMSVCMTRCFAAETFMSVGEVLDEVLQDRIFYKNSGGGVTLSGGRRSRNS